MDALFNSSDEVVEMLLKQVFEQACRDRHT
jgi:hypothetical protein